MFIHQSTLQILVPGEPSPEALHREEYFNESKDDTADGATTLPTAPKPWAALLP